MLEGVDASGAQVLTEAPPMEQDSRRFDLIYPPYLSIC